MTNSTTTAHRSGAQRRALRTGVRTGLATAALLLAAGCASGSTVESASAGSAAEDEPTAAAPTPQQVKSDRTLAVTSLLRAEDVPPAPPGSFVDGTGPVTSKGDVVGQPSRQVMTCTPLEIADGDAPGPAEPDATRAASSSSVIGVAQVDQYAVVYLNDAAARSAEVRARELADDCERSFAVHSPGANAQATIAPAPGTIDGFQVRATYTAGNASRISDEASAVLRSGRVVLFLRTSETGSGPNAGQKVDGILDPEWTDQLISAAAANLAG